MAHSLAAPVSSLKFNWDDFVNGMSTQPIPSLYGGYRVPDASLMFNTVVMLIDLTYRHFDFSKSPRQMLICYGKYPTYTKKEYIRSMELEMMVWNENFNIRGLSVSDQLRANQYVNAVLCIRRAHLFYWSCPAATMAKLFTAYEQYVRCMKSIENGSESGCSIS